MHRLKKIQFALLFLFILLLIANSDFVSNSASQAIQLCIHSVIPALFPLMLLTSQLRSILPASPAIFEPVCNFLHIPVNFGKYFLIGSLGGYPTGAIHLNSDVESGVISQSTANQLLMFCNNAGPAFIFGIGSAIFDTPYIPLLVWGVHILSAFLVGKNRYISSTHRSTEKKSDTPAHSVMENCIKNMALICGWILIFHVLSDIIAKVFGNYLPKSVVSVLMGFLEISQGALSLKQVHSEMLKLILFSIYLNLGGVCVALQTISVTPQLKFKYYIQGKLLQCLYGILLLGATLPFFQNSKIPYYFTPLCTALLVLFLFVKAKKTVAITRSISYNKSTQNG